LHKLSFKEQIFTGITLFSMFFGAGNLIFPPILGAQGGEHALLAFIGFAVSAVGLPILGVIAIVRSGGLRHLADRAGKKFSFIFTLAVYLSIGPCLAIPRTASTSFEMAVTPFVSDPGMITILRVVYSVVFFGAALYIAFNPSKLIDTLGKKLAPTLLVLIALLFAGCLISGISGTGEVAAKYTENAAVTGFIDGYQTMDAIAALVYGIVLVMNIKGKGITEENDVAKVTIKAGYVAAVIFICVYGALTYIGTTGAASAQNGAEVLTAIANTLFGKVGNIILAIIFVIACINTCISLICSCSEYFNEICPKISYKGWVIILSVFSTVVSNAGLNAILVFSVPVLNCIYPIVIVLILLAFLPKSTLSRPLVYPLTVFLAAFVGVVHTFSIPGLSAVCSYLPLYGAGLGWIVPAVVGVIIGLLYKGKKA